MQSSPFPDDDPEYTGAGESTMADSDVVASLS